jgi:hypothetical protein
VNEPEAVGQAIETRLELWKGAWFLNTAAGVPYATKVIGKFTGQTRDVVMRAAILQTEGVQSLVSYSSEFNPDTRGYSVNGVANTIFGQTPFELVF